MAESMQGLHRTCRCAEVTTEMVGKEVTLMGWVAKARNKGGLVFVDLRDRSGIMQLIFENGSIAYVPYSTSNETVTFTVKGTQVSYTIPESVKATAYVGGTIDATTGATSGGVKGIYYSDEKCTMPIYSPKPLTSSDVKNGKDAALANVTLGQDGNYYLTNSVTYAYK